MTDQEFVSLIGDVFDEDVVTRSISSRDLLAFFSFAGRNVKANQWLSSDRATIVILVLLDEHLAMAWLGSSVDNVLEAATPNVREQAKHLQDMYIAALGEVFPRVWGFTTLDCAGRLEERA